MSRYNYRLVAEFHSSVRVDTTALADVLEEDFTQMNDLDAAIIADLRQYPTDLSTHTHFFISVGYSFLKSIDEALATWGRFMEACSYAVVGSGALGWHEQVYLEIYNDNEFHRLVQTDDPYVYTGPEKHFKTTSEDPRYGDSWLPMLKTFDGTCGCLLFAVRHKGVAEPRVYYFRNENNLEALMSLQDGLYSVENGHNNLRIRY